MKKKQKHLSPISHLKPNRSPFAGVLMQLVDRTHVFETRREWAQFLGVTPSAISQWTSDRTLPRQETLRALVSLVRARTASEYCDPLKRFDALAKMPAEQVVAARHADAIGGSVQNYLIEPAIQGVIGRFRTLVRSLDEPEQQETVIQRTAAALNNVVDPKRAAYVDFVYAYHAGKEIDETDLPDILTTKFWERVIVIAPEPYEFYSHPKQSSDSELILNVFQTSMKYLVLKCKAHLSYIFSKRKEGELPQKISSVTSELFPFARGSSALKVDLRPIEQPLFERLLDRASRIVRKGPPVKPVAVILFNPTSTFKFGYSWFEDTGGYVLSPDTIDELSRLLNLEADVVTDQKVLPLEVGPKDTPFTAPDRKRPHHGR